MLDHPNPVKATVLVLDDGDQSERDKVMETIRSVLSNRRVFSDRFSTEIRLRAHGSLGIVINEMGTPAGAAQFEGDLHRASQYFGGRTPQEYYDHFTRLLRQFFGNGFEGRWLAERIRTFDAAFAARHPNLEPPVIVVVDESLWEAAYEPLLKNPQIDAKVIHLTRSPKYDNEVDPNSKTLGTDLLNILSKMAVYSPTPAQ